MPPVFLREDNSEAKEVEGSLFASTVAIRTSSCFSERWFLRILLSIYGAVAYLCDELSESFRALEKPNVPCYLDKTEFLAGPSIAETHANAQQRGKPGARLRAKIRTIVRRPRSYPKLCSEVGLNQVEKGQYFCILLRQKKEKRCNIYAENTQSLGTKRRLV